jgi:hypothetical protein
MNAEERHLAEIQRIEMALAKTKSEHLKRDYTKHLIKLKRELEEYRNYRRNYDKNTQTLCQSPH